MKVKISPSECNGKVHIPPSKSMAHRAIICASLANGKSTISNVAFSKDILATIDGMRNLGATITIYNDCLYIEGIKDFNHIKTHEINCNESGSTLRFLIPIFSLTNQKITFTGSKRLLERPLSVYQKIFEEQSLDFIQQDSKIQIHQSLKAKEYTIKGNISSQFISGLLFTLPILKEDSILHILPPFESKSYVDLTIQMLEQFGISIHLINEHTILIPGNQKYHPCSYTIEGDYSQFAFFAVYAAISNTLEITGVSPDSKQGDKEILSILNSFGTKIESISNGYRIYKSNLKSNNIDLANCPDLGPILCVLAMYSPGNTHIYHANRLRIKECDRIYAMETELKKFGVSISSTQDDIYIQYCQHPLCKENLFGYNDHRIVMALTIASACSTSTTIISDAQAISKSYPSFFEDFQHIQGKVESL